MSAKVKFVVDSTGDVPIEWLQKRDIPIFYAYVNFDKESFIDDGVQLTRAEFYRRLAAGKGLPKTSAGSVGQAKAVLAQQLAKAEHVVAFAVASQFSSIYNTFCTAANELDPSRITIVDSGSVTMGLGLVVMAAVEAAERGADAAECVAVAEDTRRRLKFYAALDTLEYLKRSGRVSSFVAGVGSLLQIKPIIDVRDGVVHTYNRVRTMSKAVQSMVELAQSYAPLERLAILHTHHLTGAEDLKARLNNIAPEQTLIADVTTALGTHIGPGSLGVVMVKRK